MVHKEFSQKGGSEMSKDKIIQAIRRNSIEVIPLPEQIIKTRFKSVMDLKEDFKANLTLVGAEFVELKGIEEVILYVKENCSDAVDFSKQEISLEYSPAASKKKLNQLGTALLDAQFAVAENGAIWLDNSTFPNRLIPFIAQRLIITLDSNQIVIDMHEAYSRLKLENIEFGVFISGPSKTADIEQSLVYGAHGAKSLLVIIF